MKQCNRRKTLYEREKLNPATIYADKISQFLVNQKEQVTDA